MRKVHLFTENNDIIRKHLSELEFDCPDLPSELSRLTPGGTIVYQISDNSLNAFKTWLELNPKCEHIAVTEKITIGQKDFFLQNGAAYVLQTTKPEKISAFIKAKTSAEPKNDGKMLVYDDRKNTSAILRAITSHFGYEAVFVDSTDSFFKSITDGTYHFVLINLGCGGLDIAAFVRGCHSHPKIKASPIIAYKDTTDGLYINELISGINRYISYILSPEELYSFLLDILFKKELMPLIKQLNIESRFSEFSRFCSEPLSRIYYEAKGNILAISDILDKKNISSILSAMADIEKSLIRVSALNWLYLSEEKIDIEKSGYLCNTPTQALSGQMPAANKL